MKICVLQLPTLSMSENRIDYYIKIAKDNKSEIVLIGEYVLNSFFNELKKMPNSIIKEQTVHKKELFLKLSKKYNIVIIAPLIIVKNNEIYKVCAKFSPNKIKIFNQQFLINYSHWNEENFYSNSKNFNIDTDFNMPIFSLNNFKFGIAFGFEAHFDIVWKYFMQKNVDCILMPTASTFDSNERWEMLLKMRAWLNSVFIIRANRIGKTQFLDKECDFYGNSFAIDPNGELVNALKNEEGVMLCNIEKNEINEARKLWKFKKILDKKCLI